MTDQPYIVLARKHRPQQFADVVGQEHVGRTLQNAIEQNRVAHALLFTGPRGVGKTSSARILARALNCQQGPTPTPCGACASCREIGQGSSVDVIEIDAASNRGIDEIRELRDAVRYPPSRERYKVYIIDEVHMLTTQAFNALLKTLEEPPPRVQFIFATTEPHKIPDTILSRCQRFDFRRIPLDLIQAHLAEIASGEGIEAEPEALRLIAQQSEGCMRDAQSLLDQLISFSDGAVRAELASRVLGAVGRDTLFRLSAALLDRNVDGVLAIVDEAYQIGINLVQLASDFLEHLRDLTVAAVTSGPGGLGHLTDGERQGLAEQAARTHASVLQRMFSILIEAAEEMSRSAYPRLMLEMALIRMTAIEPVEPVGELIARIESLAQGDLPRGGGGPTSSGHEERRPAEPTAPTPTPTPTRPPAKRDASAPPSVQETEAPDHVAAWRQLVQTITESAQSVGAMLKFAELLSTSGVQFEARLTGAFLDLLQASDKRAVIESTARELFGPDAAVTLRLAEPGVEEDADAPSFSVSQVEAEERARERQRLSEVIANHPVTTLVRDTFRLTPEQIQITPVPPEGETPAAEVES